MTAEQVLVIFLSTFLALFLLLAVITLVLLIKLINKLRAIADSAQNVTENIGAAAEAFRNAAGPIAYGKGFVNIMNALRRGKRGK